MECSSFMKVYEDFMKKHNANERMKEVWEVAPKILKPNPRELKRSRWHRCCLRFQKCGARI